MMEAEDDRLVEAFVERAQLDLATISEQQLDDGWARLQVSSAPSARRRTRPAWGVRVAFAGALAAAAVAIAVYRWVPGDNAPPLQYSVERATSTGAGGSVTDGPGPGSRLLFSDGSHIDFSALTKVTVDALAARGAQVTLIDGAIDVFVKPRAQSAWMFAAGTFAIRVKGTSFRLSYSSADQRMGLHVTSGLVEVAGTQGRAITVSGGESIELVAKSALAGAAADSADAQPSAGEDESGRPPDTQAKPAGSAQRRTALHSKQDGALPGQNARQEQGLAWSKLITQGRFAEVVADAQNRGIDTTLAQATAGELSSLADAARYTKRFDLARQVLLAMRVRFAGTEPARDASFFLGRLGESTPGQPEAAVGWYEAYLREAPGGVYASEALGREMTLLANQDLARATKLAKQYLARFPRGSQAELARSLLVTGPGTGAD
jgi:ferric-dicitrate binding protein FerR (iron transport regulator)